MGSVVKKITRPVRKIAKKIIPKEIRPALPFIASAAFGPAGMFSGVGSQYVSNAALRQALAAGITSAATDEDGNPLRAAGLAAAPALLSQGVGALGQGTGSIADFVNKTKTITDGDKIMKTKSLVERAQALAKPSGIMDTAKVIGGQTAIDQSAKLAEINQDEIDKYNEELRKQGVLDKTKRRSSIYNIYINAGYEPDYVNSMLDRYGYESGGRIDFANGGGYRARAAEAMKGIMTMKDLLKDKPVAKPATKIEADEDEEIEIDEDGKIKISRKDDLATGLQAAAAGVEKAFGRSFGEMEPVPMLRFAQGGEVEIEEETDDLGIMDLMRDQGIEYGEQVSAPGPKDGYDDIARQLFGKGYKDLTPEELEMFQEELERLMNKFRSGMDDEGIMQMASGYKTDIEEMYEQYVFEMEEQGLQPMSFSQFLAQARAGMADGGEVSINQIEMLIKKGADNDLIKTYVEGSQDGVIDQIRESMKKKQNKADGGRIGFAGGGNGYKDYLQDLKDGIISPDTTFNEWLDNNAPDPDYDKVYAQGGRIDGGIMEKDMRGGGFIPEGTKERADDVPARLSKNEFVMTADAVRAAGGGSVNQGAKRMYDMMYNLEGKV